MALPEFFTTPLITGAPASDAVLPASSNSVLDLLCGLAREYHGEIGGSFLVAENGEVYNRYHYATADGRVFIHDKDLPTMWENAFYTGGTDGGVFDTGAHRVGAAVCWELIREQTVARMQGRVDFAITGTHWWDMPDNWPLVRTALGPLSRRNHELSEQAPAEFARRGAEEGPGWVAAEIEIGAVRPIAASASKRYWIPRLPLLHRLYWHHQNRVGRSLYKRRGRTAGLRAAAARERNA